MSNSQSILSIGALLFLSLISLRFNTSALENATVEVENKIYLTAFSLADDLIEEIKQKAFDAATVDFPTTNRADLTSAYSLGHASWEVYPNYNDIDDFNGYTRTISVPHAENYNVSSKVHYVSESDPNTKVMTQTFHKKVKVTVTSPYISEPVSLSFIFTLK
ncbi:MAG: hypothetical protein KJN64_03505 [Ignavibacteria bacterium]|nr:hypothetical protein [Ignavibacteria bacterium]MBT8382183.1 hypothetical protein [Ignavibacteria bacterium]MBT8390883.1 hypothetical protein [Ignavibacteria bacterium]NNJ51733.1 hypothetical protein [Ignavibacteriaceae bacterium]NNL20924.1 hypothetical protein [Ignavibacteriaceae bacterium]